MDCLHVLNGQLQLVSTVTYHMLKLVIIGLSEKADKRSFRNHHYDSHKKTGRNIVEERKEENIKKAVEEWKAAQKTI